MEPLGKGAMHTKDPRATIAVKGLNLLGPDREEQAFSLSIAERWYPTMTDQKNRHASLLG